LSLCAKDLLIAAMVDASALGADDLIADETNRFEAKGAITVRFRPGAAVESQADLFVCSEGIAAFPSLDPN
jgi:hypothetical protein